MYQQISTRTLFTHSHMTLIEDEVLLPNGKRGLYLKKQKQGHAATVICRDEDGRILVEKEYSYVPNVSLYQFPGGGIGLEEEPATGANRELTEELGLAAGTLTLIGSYYLDHRKSDERMYVFLGQDLQPATADSADDFEGDIQEFWLSEEEIEELIASGEIVNSAMLASWAVYRVVRTKA
jgi:ADP-ribose pyrophosphatase